MNAALRSPPVLEPAAGVSDFGRDGFAVLEGYFDDSQIDRAVAAMRILLATRGNEIVVDSLSSGRRSFWAQADDPETRNFKFNDLYLRSPEIRAIALDPGLSDILGSLLGAPPVLSSSLNFEKGSGQPMHIDSLYMTPRTPHALAAAWVALEDVHPHAGPLVYYPGSHKIPLYTFNDGTHHASAEEEADWFDYIDVQIRLRGLRERTFLARKGDVLIWHADLVHGGRPITDPARTHSSLVCHYFTEADCLERGSDIVPENAGYWMRRLPLPVFSGPYAFGPDCPFPEKTYLERHADVRESVEDGRCRSGQWHYREFGFREGRGV